MLGCCLVSFHFLLAILCPQALHPCIAQITWQFFPTFSRPSLFAADAAFQILRGVIYFHKEEEGVLAFCVGIVVTKWVWQLQGGSVRVYGKVVNVTCVVNMLSDNSPWHYFSV